MGRLTNLSRYAAIAALTAALGASGLAAHLGRQNQALTARVAVLEAERVSMAARIINIHEDQKSDQAIDNLTADDLLNVPEHWRVPE